LYDEEYYRYRENSRDFIIEMSLLYRMLDATLDSKILEVGCGGGRLLSFLKEKGHEPVGVDLLDEAVKLARELTGGCEVICCGADLLPFPDKAFDRIINQHLIEHLEDPKKALAEWYRLLTPGGVLSICTPNAMYPSARIFDDPSHVHIYERRELCRLVSSSGFEVQKSITVFPHLRRDRISVHVGVPLYRIFQYAPYFRERGRSLLLSARKPLQL
jgi:SAM-dependent methyltransferase